VTHEEKNTLAAATTRIKRVQQKIDETTTTRNFDNFKEPKTVLRKNISTVSVIDIWIEDATKVKFSSSFRARSCS